MTYQEITKEIKQCQEQLIQAGFVELIAPYFFVNVQPNITEPAEFQRLDQFVFLITLNEQILRSVPDDVVRNILIQQMLQACRNAQEESIRWRLLIQEVNKKMEFAIPDHKYQSNELLEMQSQTPMQTDYADGYVGAQACVACGYKNVVPYIGPRLSTRILCPMCEQDTCVQAA